MPLPNPKGKQKDVLYLAGRGHHAVLGTAGSGKTTIALLRAAHLSDPQNPQSGPTLVVTFNRSLVKYLRHYGGNQVVMRVQIENFHKFAMGYLASRGQLGPRGEMLDDGERDRLVLKAVARIREKYPEAPIFENSDQFFLDEFVWLSKRGYLTPQQYKLAERRGRQIALAASQRPYMFEVVEEYRRLRAEGGKRYDYLDIADAVETEFLTDDGQRRYRHIVIDEGQTLWPVAIRALVAAVPEDGSITFFGDMAQQSYGTHQIPWNEAGLKIKQVWRFDKNYRNTRQVAELALAISRMPYYEGVREELVSADAPSHDGPKPALVPFKNRKAEIAFVAKYAAEAATIQTVGIAVRRWSDAADLIAALPTGTRVHRVDKRLLLWTGKPGVYVCSYHSITGMEFDAVYLPFLGASDLPDEEDISLYGPEGAAENNGRLLYIGVTRARTRLVMSYTGALTELLPNDPDLYDLSRA